MLTLHQRITVIAMLLVIQISAINVLSLQSFSFIRPSYKIAPNIKTVQSVSERMGQMKSSVLFSSGSEVEHFEDSKRPRDMKYIPPNILRNFDNFENIRKVGGTETVNDVYVRDPERDTYWFAGKVARCTGTVSLEQAIGRLWSFIEEHACRLRLVELSTKYGTLEIWTAPPDSEMDVSYNRPHIIFTKMTKSSDYCVKEVKATEIGFQNEVYEDGEEGFRTKRNDDGTPVNKEIISPE